MYIYRCQDSLEGIFTGIYRIYEDHRNQEDVYVSLDDEPRLFSTVIEVLPDKECSQKVARTLRKRFGEWDYEHLCLALATTDEEKAQAVFATVAAGLYKRLRPGHLFDDLASPWVNKAFKLARNASGESGHWREFLRFEELGNGILYSRFNPRNNILVYLLPHFADRFPEENFVIRDEARNLFGVHPAGEDWFLLRGQFEIPESLELSPEEERYQLLFKGFCRSISIEERRNLKLQQGLLPLRFREHMTEFS